jgi:kynurenine formamidase
VAGSKTERFLNEEESKMSFKRIACAAVCSCAVMLLTACSSRDSVSLTHMVDLTHTLSGNFPIVPVPGLTFPFDQKPIASLAKNGVFAEEWHMIAHNGTHMDAPNHYIEGGRAMDGYDVRELIAPAVVIDIHQRAANDRDTQLQVADIRDWESHHGRVPRHSAVFMYSGWDRKAIEDPKTYVGLDGSGVTHFPTFSPDAVAFLVKERDIVGIGVDTLSFDQVEPTQKAAAHRVLLGADRWGIECINHLTEIPSKGATIFAGALKVAGASASPIRLIAVW